MPLHFFSALCWVVSRRCWSHAKEPTPFFLQHTTNRTHPVYYLSPPPNNFHTSSMCDSCACTSFSPHLWKAGECRDCHHPITSHAIVPTIEEPATNHVEMQQKHTFVGKLSHDKLEPFSLFEEQNTLTGSGGISRGRDSANFSTLRNSSRLSITGRLQPFDDGPVPVSTRHRRSASYNKTMQDGNQNTTMHRRTSSHGKPAESDGIHGSPLAYEDRLSASYRKSREIQAKRKSFSDASGDYNEKEHHRTMIIEELVVTERDYCRDMDYLTQVCSHFLCYCLLRIFLFQYCNFLPLRAHLR
jgi:hypothetical protein